ncbi:glycoside hydrolase family 16 protein [Sphaerobolus stellatus SS14]|uniref:Glycoside hydrolase family 16 protein n=1 Tax=Sphaerobolus stellatus (strain SS14) TaxID=990650 RepID=A0A0C9VYJ2_SPHS4|nr:glycoside hydrolase family 16 protein [Sphaerobolus stellatus SS14]
MVSDVGSDNTYALDYNGVANSLQEIKGSDARYLSTSYSTISFDEDSGFEKDTDRPLRPCTLVTEKIHKPWMENKDWRIAASYWIFFWSAIGMAGAALFIWHGWTSVPLIKQPLCLVMSDDFNTFDTVNTWHQEVDLSGFQNGEFEMTTTSPNNSYVKNGTLFIVPTLTSEVIGVANVFDAYTYNATGCTNTVDPDNDCGAVSNATAGVVINPVMSARITTQKSFSIAYGKVEIRARMPKGDWIWPSIWMLPVDNVYGNWPRSGKFSIVQSRGNSIRYQAGGQNSVHAALQWGPTVALNRNGETSGAWAPRRGSFGDDFHTYTLEWTQDYLRVSVDTKLKHSLDLRFNTPFWNRGNFPDSITNGTGTITLTNPWEGRGESAPFDQRFYLIMDVAVGGTHGYFPDNVGGKPWLDESRTAMRDFALAQDEWYPTWPANLEERGMAIDYVKMWQLC